VAFFYGINHLPDDKYNKDDFLMKKVTDPNANLNYVINPKFHLPNDIDLKNIDFKIIDNCSHKKKEVYSERMCVYLENGNAIVSFIAIICIKCGRTEFVSEEIIKRHRKKKKNG
jgi:predicted nucleic-acid-binding Zn-ribbon protein